MNTERKEENVRGQKDQASQHRQVEAGFVWACGEMDTGDRQAGRLPIGKAQLMKRGTATQAEVGTPLHCKLSLAKEICLLHKYLL